MELAKVMAKGQITIPINVRRKLNLKEGDKDFSDVDVMHARNFEEEE